MQELAELHRFNLWANANLIAAVRGLKPEQLTERRDGMYDSVLRVLVHFAAVEAAYLSLMRSESFEPGESSLESVERSLAHSGRGLVELAASEPLDRTFHIPWFGRDFPLATGLRQVLTHSANHRADVNQWLPRFGVESANLDYIGLALAEG
jgi:uncharacterized damage-inducible protein DinB